MKYTIDGKRFYDIEGKPYPSVTTILGIIDKGEGFKKWLLKSTQEGAEKQTKEACDLGTRVHEIIEAHVKSEITGNSFDFASLVLEMPADQKEKAKLCLSAYSEWENEHHVKYIQSELFLVSKLHGYAGTTDIIAKVDGAYSLLDIKTSKSFWDTMGLQLSAYAKAYTEKTDIPIEKRFILRLDKENGKPHFKEYQDEFITFMHAFEVWKWRNKWEAK